MSKKPKVIANVVVGTPQVAPAEAGHVKGIRAGNDPAKKDRDPGRSTGIRPDDHAPIDPAMPKVSQA